MQCESSTSRVFQGLQFIGTQSIEEVPFSRTVLLPLLYSDVNTATSKHLKITFVIPFAPAENLFQSQIYQIQGNASIIHQNEHRPLCFIYSLSFVRLFCAGSAQVWCVRQNLLIEFHTILIETLRRLRLGISQKLLQYAINRALLQCVSQFTC